MGRCRLWGVPQFALCVRSERIHPSGRSGPQFRRWRQVEGERLVSEQPHHAAEDLAPKPSQIPAKTFKASSSIVTVTANPVAKQTASRSPLARSSLKAVLHSQAAWCLLTNVSLQETPKYIEGKIQNAGDDRDMPTFLLSIFLSEVTNTNNLHVCALLKVHMERSFKQQSQ